MRIINFINLIGFKLLMFLILACVDARAGIIFDGSGPDGSTKIASSSTFTMVGNELQKPATMKSLPASTNNTLSIPTGLVVANQHFTNTVPVGCTTGIESGGLNLPKGADADKTEPAPASYSGSGAGDSVLQSEIITTVSDCIEANEFK